MGEEGVLPIDASLGSADFAVIGVGVSAGGFEPLAQLARSLARGDAAVVVVQQRPGRGAGARADLLRGRTALPVVTITDGLPIAAGTIHLAPPGAQPIVDHGVLRLRTASEQRPAHAIDAFFRSLAAAFGPRAIGVVLSGAGADGTLGLRAIREAGGITFAQDPASATHARMPERAIEAGGVDRVLTPAGIGEELTRSSAVASDVGPRAVPPLGLDPLARVFDALRRAVNADASMYAPGVVERRIRRRMVLHRLAAMEEYVALLEADPRDCGTGEEAYSLAIAVAEQLPRRREVKVQIFATDVDERALERARRRTYPPGIELDVSPERLERFFTRTDKGYRLRDSLRGTLLLSRHDLARDPPFSRLDLVSCGNLLGRFRLAMQHRLLNTFHYALNPDGFLLIGSSESLGDAADLFTPVDRSSPKRTVFRKKAIASEALLHRRSDSARAVQELRFLSEASTVLASSIDYEETLSAVARLSVRELADFCFVDLVEDDGRMWRLKVACADPAKAGLGARLEQIPIDPMRPRLFSALLADERSEGLLIEDTGAERADPFAKSAEHLKALRLVDARSLLLVPMVAHSRLVGALVFVRSREGRRYDQRDLKVAEQLAHRAALFVENARLHRLALRATQARDDVLGVVAHDLRNPIQAIETGVAVWQRRLEKSGREPDPTERQIVATIAHASGRAKRLIRDLLDVARLDAGRLSIEPRAIDPRALVEMAAEEQALLLPSAKLELRVDVAAGVPRGWGDFDRLLQVLENLIGNATKFTPAGGRITLAVEAGDGEIVFRVSDTGSGMAPEELPHVFDRFWQPKREKRRGAGLGLAIVKGIVEAHGGHVRVESVAGRGTTFSFTVPAAPPEPIDAT